MGKLFSNIISRLNKFFFLYSDEYWWAVFIDCQCIYLFISDLFACHGSGLRIYLFPPQFIFGFSTQSQRRALQVCSVFSCVKCMHRIDAQYILQWILQFNAAQCSDLVHVVVVLQRGCTKIKWSHSRGSVALFCITPAPSLINSTRLIVIVVFFFGGGGGLLLAWTEWFVEWVVVCLKPAQS